MVAAGIIDPLKVVRTGLENAASSSGTLLTTEVAIFDIKTPLHRGGFQFS